MADLLTYHKIRFMPNLIKMVQAEKNKDLSVHSPELLV